MTHIPGVKYLWIDAFCILQDDHSEEARVDKERELGKMADIYKNATITIAASRATGADKGFLHERQAIGFETPNSVFLQG